MFEYIKKFVFPSHCIICDEILPFGNKLENEFLCNDCRSKIEFIKEPTCKKCGAMIYGDDETYCTRCISNMHQEFEYGFGLCRYNNAIKESLHKIKYGGRKEYIEFYGKCIAKVYHNKIKQIKPDFLVPVPIHKERYRKRTYNQATVLAYAISKELMNYGIDIGVNEDLIYRKENTKVLNQLDLESRNKELDNAFIANNVNGIDKILLVDDIYTTGGTINTIAKILKKTSVRKVYFTVISIVDNL